MKAFLYLFRQFNEVNLQDSRFGSQQNAIWLKAADRRVFVFLSVNRFEVVGGWVATRPVPIERITAVSSRAIIAVPDRRFALPVAIVGPFA
jgi:hypothetical protein